MVAPEHNFGLSLNEDSMFFKQSRCLAPTGSDNEISSLQVKGTESLLEQNIAKLDQGCVVEPLGSFQRLKPIPLLEEERTLLIVSESAILSALEKQNPREAAGLDKIPN